MSRNPDFTNNLPRIRIAETLMRPELPELSHHQLECLRRFLHFDLPVEELRSVLEPLVTFKLDGPNTLQTVHYSAGIPKNPIKVTRRDIDSAVERVRTGQIKLRQSQQWATMVLLNDAFDWTGEDEEDIAEMLNDLGSIKGLTP